MTSYVFSGWRALSVMACASLFSPHVEQSPTQAPVKSPVAESASTQSASSMAPWVARPDGVGPVRVGMRIGPTARLLKATARTERIEPDESCGQSYLSTVPEGVSFMVEGDTIVRVDIETKDVKTVEGIGVGASEAEVLSRYKGRVKVSAHPYEGPAGHYLTVTVPSNPKLRVLFETDGKRVTSYRVGRRDAVELAEGCA
jgi:hypothetical protein